MAKVFAHLRLIAGALALAFVVATAMPVAAQQPNSVNPNAAAVKEQQLLQQLNKIEGRGTIPDVKSYVLEHPAGREWREFHGVTLKWIGGIFILGMLALLTIYYLWRGTLPIEEGRSGRVILRFNVFERFVHWLTAVSFVILGITGLNITFGRSLILPWMGAEAFSTWAEWAKFSHNYVSFAFTIGVVLMFLIWVANNIPTRADLEWFKGGGGMFGGKEPPAYKFNGGEKLIFWISMIGGGLVIVTGFVLLFPFYGTSVSGMELAQIIHSVVAVLYVSAMFTHIYMGTIGVEGAFEAMVDGTVDANWAKERHSLWHAEETQGSVGQAQAMRQPAE
ncbi:MAG TPA: formate dehydrogenase subunit gamma [Pseudolabrys sp.]|jgi:formate dehydrogenase subunit gamma